MRLYSLSSSSDRAALEALREDSLQDEGVERAVKDILRDVRARGDDAVRDCTARFDGVMRRPL